ncbi:conserved hypothetical protein [Methanothermus fervidus DSM 2088]|uniref:DUF3147 domain-containing protein n=1 Tax=Methanothermus fervidus (strain ATCC 43054 / DSM 2088 / JCM 10308 / V24 S) TaxID=523846 RepID=E3GW60_METFV|nr:DUF3147 family protein [Methanothermus fervidus]ADP77825.1 conserved hypothetical protein [Methanothermus fervidus DSM 2088]
MEKVKLIFYFILGGIVVALTTYFGSERRGILAAFIAMFPSVTVLTLLTIYLEAGTDSVISYVKGLLLLTPPWMLYLLSLVYILPRYGFLTAILVGVIIYFSLASILMFLI